MIEVKPVLRGLRPDAAVLDLSQHFLVSHLEVTSALKSKDEV